MLKALATMIVALIFTVLAAGVGVAEDWVQVAIPETTASSRILDVDIEGNILWMSTDGDGLIGHDGQEWLPHKVEHGGLRGNSFNRVVFIDSDNEKWVTRDLSRAIDRLDDGGTFLDKDDDRWTYYNTVGASQPGPVKNKRIFSMAEDSFGNKWYGFRDENHIYADYVVAFLLEGSDATTDDDTWYHFDNAEDETEFWDDDVRALAVDLAGRLWIGYAAAGIDVWDHGGPQSLADTSFADDTWTRYDEESVLPSDEVRELHVDERGRVWIGTLGGLAMYDPTGGSWMTVEDLPGVQARAIDTDAQGRVWVGTDNGVAMLYTNGVVGLTYGTIDGIHDDRVDHIAVDRANGVVWCVSVDDATGETYLQYLRAGSAPGTAEIFLYPNPWIEGKSTEFMSIFGAPDGSTVEVFDITGNLLRTLAPSQPYVWDSLDDAFNEVPSGGYVVKVETPAGKRIFLTAAIVR
jgi:hypothetical protein